MIQKYIGESCILLCSFLLAFSTVASHVLISQTHPLIMIFYSFLFAVILMSFIKIEQGQRLLPKILKHWKIVLIANCSTAIDWIFMFIALQYISSSLVNCFIFGVSPMATLLLSAKTYQHKKLFIKDLILAMLIGVTLFLLSAEYYNHLNLTVAKTNIITGIILCAFSGLATATTVISCKALHHRGFSAVSVMKSRYLLLVLAAFIMMITFKIPFYIHYKIAISLFSLAIVFVILPAFLFQKGLEKTHAVTFVILSALTPVMTYLLQLFETQYFFRFGELSLVILLSIIICIASVIKKNEI